ncbi:BTAD domain-containing putative transcriptional regulator [Paenibacillus sp.]|uniref:AfsR/SARP family transcriptional regulator n=1 Tax=Paenibacillus sp. TaxID=58172 RepID=UPI002829B8B8|nr:BTAD domain-containing putative transcriptional regulator [Paenibacillus sp.]MDR0271089.1 winged helix-turn-helix domain-containing protein [Paenibacillus sp.]
MDYLLKPIEADRLAKTVARMQRDRLQGIAPEGMSSEARVHSRLEIRLFGPFFAGIDGGLCMKWRTAKEKELLAYLANQEDKRVHRDLIIECLWPDESYQKAKVNLHTCIYLLRKNLKHIGFEGIVNYENGGYYLDPERVHVDVREFRKRMKELKRIHHPNLENIREMLSYRRGPFLQEDSYVWADQEAEAFENSTYEWKLVLAEMYLRELDFNKAVNTAEDVIESSPYDEEAYRILMRSYAELGKNNLVHAIYRRLEDELEELHVRPSKQSCSLYEEICGRREIEKRGLI